MSYAIGFDLGGTTMTSALVNIKTGEVLRKNTAPTPAQESVEVGLDAIKKLIETTADGTSFESIGMGVPGLINPLEGWVHTCPNLPEWDAVHLGKILSEHFGVPARIDNDVNVMGLGEMRFGAGKGARHTLCLTVGTGIGGAVFINGELYHGASFSAGEVGHINVISQGGKPCGCGSSGCLETVAGTAAILERAEFFLFRGESPILQELLDNAPLTPALIAQAAQAGDKGAQKVWQEIGRWIGIGLAGLVNVFNPERIIIGGGIAQAGALIFDPLRESLKEYAFKLPAETASVIPAALGPDAGIIGAASLSQLKVEH